MYYVRIEKIFYNMQGLHFTSNNHFLGSYWRMCSTKTKKVVSQEGGRHGKLDADEGRGREDAQHDGEGLEKGMATRSSIVAWRIPWTEEPGWLQSVRFQRVRHD